MPTEKKMKEQYKCQSYYDDDNVLRDCTCGKCGMEFEKQFDEEKLLEVVQSYDFEKIKDFVSLAIEGERENSIEILQGQRDLISPHGNKEYVKGIDWCISILSSEENE